MWTLVGGGAKPLWASRRPMADVVPQGVDWTQDAFAGVDPESNTLKLKSGATIKYDFLVMAGGLRLNWDAVKGLREAIDANNGVSSNYSATSVENTWRNIRNLHKGRAIFTFPNTPIKCAGAPQKIMYLADEYWRNAGRRDAIDVGFYSALGKMFAVDKYSQRLGAICDKRGLTRNFFHSLVAVDHITKQATFAKVKDGKHTDETVTVGFDMLHVTPPMAPLKEFAASPLANAAGWIDVDKETCQHTKYKNVFSLGDCSSLPTSKTAAAVAAQNGVVKTNLRCAMTGIEPQARYDGYTSCPLITGRNSLMLAEFSGYTLTPQETFPYDQGTETSFAYWLKAEVMPAMYWDYLLKNNWHGPQAFRALFSPLKDPKHNTNPSPA